MTVELIALAVGWVALLLVLVLLIILVRKWKASFREREWVLIPSPDGERMVNAIETNVEHAMRLEEVARGSMAASEATREDFSILRTQLDAQAEEIRDLRRGEAQLHRRPFVLAMVRALDAIEVDEAAGTDPRTTLQGVQLDLRETLEDNRVEIVFPQVGDSLPARGVDAGAARHLETSDSALVGTIASVERPAFIAIGPGGAEDLLRPASVTVYVPRRVQEDA